jgi:hypothetical protein
MFSAFSESFGNDNAEMSICLVRYPTAHGISLLLHRHMTMAESAIDEAISSLDDNVEVQRNKRQKTLSKVYSFPCSFDFKR